MSVPVALLRHFPTDWNLEHRLQGRTDRPLTDAARTTLAGLALPPGWQDAALVASPLQRAAETARILARDTRGIRHDARLVELSWGAWEGRTADELRADPAARFRPTGDLGWLDRAPGGESAAEAWERARPALRDIAASGARTVLVIHKALMRVILGQAWGWQGPDAGSVRIRRGRLYPIAVAPDGTPGTPEDPVRLAERTTA